MITTKRRPRIGVSGRRTIAQALGMPPGFIDAPVELYMSEYSSSVVSAGGTPFHVAFDADPADVVDAVDGLVFAGGADVDPRRYGAVPGSMSGVLEPLRDEYEIALARAAIEAGKPVLGICRGAQLINVVLGGTLVEHLAVGEGESHSSYAYPRAYRSHSVDFKEGSLAHSLYGARAMVNSFHHQAVSEPGNGVVVTGRASDGVVESYEVAGAPVVGIQWHPECFGQDPIFNWLVESSAERQRQLQESAA